MKKTILIADDEREIVELLKLFLEKEGYEIAAAYDGEEAWELLNKQPVQLAIIDIMMPRLNGFELLKRLRIEQRVPVIVISAKNHDADKILGLQLGADDFIAKPFNPLEVVARVQAQLRRAYDFGNWGETEGPKEHEDRTEVGPLVLDHAACVLIRRGETIPLTSLEYKLLRTLMQAPGRIFTKQQLFELVWGEPYLEDFNTVMVQISRLRDKIEDHDDKQTYIKTVRGLGYKFAARAELSDV